jgi:hypothetical protein
MNLYLYLFSKVSNQRLTYITLFIKYQYSFIEKNDDDFVAAVVVD